MNLFLEQWICYLIWQKGLAYVIRSRTLSWRYYLDYSTVEERKVEESQRHRDSTSLTLMIEGGGNELKNVDGL